MKETKLNKQYNLLSTQAEKYINYFCSIYNVPGIESDDIRQVLRLKLYTRIEKYNSAYGINTFLGKVFKREMYRLMKVSKRYTKREEALGTYLECSGELESRESCYSQYDGYDILISNVIENIQSSTEQATARAVTIFKLMLNGRTCREISYLLGKSVAKINKIKNNEIKNSIALVIGEDELDSYLGSKA